MRAFLAATTIATALAGPAPAQDIVPDPVSPIDPNILTAEQFVDEDGNLVHRTATCQVNTSNLPGDMMIVVQEDETNPAGTVRGDSIVILTNPDTGETEAFCVAPLNGVGAEDRIYFPAEIASEALNFTS